MGFTHSSELTLPLEATAELQQFWRAQLAEHELDTVEDSADTIAGGASWGRIEMRLDQPTACIRVSTDDESVLLLARSDISAHLAGLDERIGQLAWTGEHKVGARLPELATAAVSRVTRLAPHYYRVELVGDALARFAQTGLHFRLLRQSDASRTPVWPAVNARGNVDWPSGEDSLYQKVYTVRTFDTASNTLVFDVFIHDGGITSEWAASEPVGQTVGLLGPGGGWFPDAETLMLFGDETALPAVLRIIENTPEHVDGQAYLLVEDALDEQTVVHSSGVTVHWLHRARGDSLVVALERATTDTPTTYWWFASSQGDTKAAQRVLRKDRAIDKHRVYAAAYWS
ncbi:MAG: siderophore-interacting protein [Pseudomonadota bacterium]